MIPFIKYSSFYEEMLMNNIYKMKYSDWINELNKSKLLINKDKIKHKTANQGNKVKTMSDLSFQNNNIYYGLIYGDPIDIKNIFCILFYTGYTTLCNLFRQEFYQNKFTKYYN